MANNLKGRDVILDYEVIPKENKPKTAKECLMKTKKMADELEDKILRR